jgi:hypothetical protein
MDFQIKNVTKEEVYFTVKIDGKKKLMKKVTRKDKRVFVYEIDDIRDTQPNYGTEIIGPYTPFSEDPYCMTSIRTVRMDGKIRLSKSYIIEEFTKKQSNIQKQYEARYGSLWNNL